MTHVLPSDEYEELVRSIMYQLSHATSVRTDVIDRPSDRFRGVSGTTHQIDVRWDLTDATGERWRLLFEARSYKKNLEQSAVFAFDGVVSDIAAVSDRRCLGVMVTTTGYQRGAKLVGESKKILLLELRSPLDKDFEGRLVQIDVRASVRIPVIRDVQVELVNGPVEGPMQGLIEVEHPDGSRIGIDRILLVGEVADLDEPPRSLHSVHRTFGPNHWVVCDGVRIGELKAIVAEVGETESAVDFHVGGRERISWIIKNALDGLRVWFADDGRNWSTN